MFKFSYISIDTCRDKGLFMLETGTWLYIYNSAHPDTITTIQPMMWAIYLFNQWQTRRVFCYVIY